MTGISGIYGVAGEHAAYFHALRKNSEEQGCQQKANWERQECEMECKNNQKLEAEKPGICMCGLGKQPRFQSGEVGACIDWFGAGTSGIKCANSSQKLHKILWLGTSAFGWECVDQRAFKSKDGSAGMLTPKIQ